MHHRLGSPCHPLHLPPLTPDVGVQPDAVKNMFEGKPARPDLLEDFRDSQARQASGSMSGRRRRDPPGSRGLFPDAGSEGAGAPEAKSASSGGLGSSQLPWDMAKGGNAPEVKGRLAPSVSSSPGTAAGGNLPWEKKTKAKAVPATELAAAAGGASRRSSGAALPWEKPRKGRDSSEAKVADSHAGGYAPSFGGASEGRDGRASNNGMKGPKASLPWNDTASRMRSGRAVAAAELEDDGLESIAI